MHFNVLARRSKVVKVQLADDGNARHKVSRLHLLGTMNVGTKCKGNEISIFRDISVWTK